MRNTIGPKKVARLRHELTLPVLAACTRGGTGHRIDLFCEDGHVWNYYRKTKGREATLELDERWIYDPMTGVARAA